MFQGKHVLDLACYRHDTSEAVLRAAAPRNVLRTMPSASGSWLYEMCRDWFASRSGDGMVSPGYMQMNCPYLSSLPTWVSMMPVLVISRARELSPALDRCSKVRFNAYVQGRSKPRIGLRARPRLPGQANKRPVCPGGLHHPRQQSAENTDKPEVDLSPLNPLEHWALLAQSSTNSGAGGGEGKKALKGAWVCPMPSSSLMVQPRYVFAPP